MKIIYSGLDDLAGWLRWKELETALAEETGFDDIGSRNDAASLRIAYQDGLAVLGLERGSDSPVGFVAAWANVTGELEVGSAWVRTDFRKNGWGSRLTSTLLQLPRLHSATVFAISQTPDFWSVARKVGLRQHTDWRSPASWDATCSPCSKVADDAKHTCPYRDRTCRLFIR